MFDLNFTTACFYLVASVMAWLALSPTRDVVAGAAPPQPAPAIRQRVPTVVLWIGLVLHAAALGVALFAGNGINLGFSHAVSLIVWLTLVSYVVLGQDQRLTRLALLYLTPVAVVAAALPLVWPAQLLVDAASWTLRLHLVAAILAYALFAVAALHAILMLFLEKRLHDGALLSGAPALPSLLKVEKLLFRLVFVAFSLLTVTLITGIFFSEETFGKPFQINQKTVFAVMSWLIFAGLLLGHWQQGWRGKVAVRWTLTGFGLLLLSYIGSKFVLEIILHRTA
jgi:ABC-type uncharacterized transport system permease subunit